MAVVPALSYSSVRTYLECPLRWKYLYVDRLPEAPRGYFSFGRTVHSVLEQLVRPLVVPGARTAAPGKTQTTLEDYHLTPGGTVGRLLSREALLQVYSSAWVPDGYNSPEEESRYRLLGEEILMRFYEGLEIAPPTPVAVEEHLEARWDGIPVHGYIDRIDRTPGGGLEIVDYKTSRELSAEDAESSDQLALYQVLVAQNYPDPVERLTLYHLRSLTPLTVPPREPTILNELHERVGLVSDGIREEAFEPTPGRQCQRCEFRTICPEFREVPAADREPLRDLVDRFGSLREEETHLNEELRRTAEELHRAAERLGVHRIPGSRGVAIRRREEKWKFPEDRVRGLLDEAGHSEWPHAIDEEGVRRILRDRELDPEIRRKISETGSRDLRWYWTVEDS